MPSKTVFIKETSCSYRWGPGFVRLITVAAANHHQHRNTSSFAIGPRQNDANDKQREDVRPAFDECVCH